ncbi:hypothetical protein KY358_04300 [Candidatus Woesearchaeota archaeon]|nr:hypothetical protein [Candidatus Woesearchaeota archaeon]
MRDENKKYPEGHFTGMWMGIGVAIFSGLGIPLSIITENPGMIAIGPGLGVAIGLSIGAGIESKYKKEGKIRSLTKEEKKKKKIAVIIGVIVLSILALLGAAFFMLGR